MIGVIGVNCIICNGFCELNEEERLSLLHGKPLVKVCDDCKKAIEWLKKFKTFEEIKTLDKSI